MKGLRDQGTRWLCLANKDLCSFPHFSILFQDSLGFSCNLFEFSKENCCESNIHRKEGGNVIEFELFSSFLFTKEL